MTPPASGPETASLLALRRWVVVSASTAVVAAAALFATIERGALSGVERALVVLSVLLLVLLWASRGTTPARLSLGAAATGALVLVAFVPAPASTDWLPIISAASFTAYFAGILLPGRLGWWAVPGGAALLASAWAGRPSNVISGALDILGGWPSVLQVALGTAGVVWAWHLLAEEAAAADRALERVETRAQESSRREERARVWRAAATRVHESVLNTIRYVVAVPAVDPERLRAQLDVDLAPPSAAAPARRAGDLVTDLRAEPGLVTSLTVGPEEVALTPVVYDVVRSAVVELARNARTHGGARSVLVMVIAEPEDRLRVVVADDGSGLEATTAPGVGLSTVLAASVEDLGGTWTLGRSSLGGTEASFVVPTDEAARPPAQPVLDQGRLLLTAPLAAQSATVLAFVIALLALGEPADTAGAAAAAISVAGSMVVVWRRRRIPTAAAFAGALVAVSVPWLLAASQWRCVESGSTAPVLNASGFALVVLLVWSRPVLVGVPTIALWAAGAVALTVEFPASCREAVGLATLNTLIGLPLILTIVGLALRASRRADAAARAVRRQEEAERARAEAAEDLNAQLHGAVADAVDVLGSVADSGGLDEASRRRLALADGRIRAAIQIDPDTAGTLALAVLRAVEAAAREGREVTVRALLASEDRRPLPAGLEPLLERLVAVEGCAPASVQAFSDGAEDHVSLVVDRSALAAAGLAAGAVLRLDDVVVEVEEDADESAPGPGSGEDRISVLVSRPVPVPAV